MAAPTLTADPDEQASRLPPTRKFTAATTTTLRLSEDSISEEMSAATIASFAAAANGSFPSHAVLVLLRSWMPGRERLEVRRKAPAKRAVVRGVRRCWVGRSCERASSGIKYGRLVERFSPEVI